MTSFIINSNKDNRLLLLPALHSDSLNRHNCLDNLSLEQLLKADFSQYKRNNSIPNYTYNTQIAYFDDNNSSSKFSSISSVGSELDSLSARSRDSIFSVESDDNGFSSSSDQEDEDYTTEGKQGLNSENFAFSKPTTLFSNNEEDDEEQKMSSPVISTSVTQETREKLSVKRLITVEEDDQEEYEQPKERSKRQRVGPSCDLCRSKKIKCDAHVEIMETDVNGDDLKLTKKSEVLDKGIINKYLTKDEIEDEFSLVYSNEKIIKFKSCSYCIAKSRPCVYKRGYTKDDILKYNTENNIKKKKKTVRSRRRS